MNQKKEVKSDLAPWDGPLSKLNDKGEEICDPRPMEMPIGFKRPMPLADEIRMMLQKSIQQELEEAGVESFEDADDFELEDEDMSSPWEEQFDQGRVWTREAEIRSGIVKEADYEAAKRIVREFERNHGADKGAGKLRKAAGPTDNAVSGAAKGSKSGDTRPDEGAESGE